MLYGGMPASIWLVPGTNDPQGGDLCEYSSNKPIYKLTDGASTPGSPSAEDLAIRFICVDGVDSDIIGLNAPGMTARTGRKPGILGIGFQGSRVPSATSKTRPFVPVTPGFCWVMTATGGTPAIGTSYGIKRVAAGDYQINVANAAAVVTVLGVDEEDYLANGSSADRYWVRAASPGGYA